MTTTTTPHAQEAAVHLPLTLLTPSPTNPRKRFNQDKIDELAASITKHGGVFQPILARRNPAATDTNGQPPFEIIAGERRWRASKQADMASVLALVRDITDFDALEIQLLENIDREDLHPLEEADGLHKLLREPNAAQGVQGYATAEELAQRIGKSRRWVFQRLALLNLCDAAREAFLADTINASVAGLIARMPDPANQAEATKRIVAGFGGEPYSFRAAADYLHKEFMLSLAKAKFDITAPYQCAGPCASCPKRSGAAPDLFAELNSGDMCQDSKCFDAKTEEAHQLQLQASRDLGQQVVSGQDARALMPSPHMLPAGHQWLDKPCPSLTDSKRTLSDIIGATHKHIVVVDHPTTETIIHLVPTTTVKQMLKAKGLLREAEQPSSQAAAPVSAPPADMARPVLKPQPLSPASLQAKIEARHGELFSTMLFKRLHAELASAAELPLLALRMLLSAWIDGDATVEAIQLLYDARGWEKPDQQRGFVFDLHRRVSTLDSRALGELLIETLLVEQLSNGWTLDDLESYGDGENSAAPLAEHFNLKLEDLDAQAYDAAAIEVKAEEARRLNPEGAAPALDATAAFVASAVPMQPKSPIKYRNAMTGETWSGRGLMPKWLKVRLEEGHTLADFDTTAAKVPA